MWNSLFGLGIVGMRMIFSAFFVHTLTLFLKFFYVVYYLRDIFKKKNIIESDESKCHII